MIEQVVQSLVEPSHGRGEGPVGSFRAGIEQLGEAWAQDATVDLGEQQGDAQAEIGDLVAMAVGEAFDEAVQAQPTQVIGPGLSR